MLPLSSDAGLLYEDLLVETEEVKLALSRLPKDVLNAREQRLKRAMVLSSQYKEVRLAGDGFCAWWVGVGGRRGNLRLNTYCTAVV